VEVEKVNSFRASRREFLRLAAAGGASLAAPAVLAACGAASKAPSGGPRAGGTLIVTQSDNPTTLDPQDTNDNIALSIEKTMFERLIDFDRKMNLVPGLATKWSASPDAMEFTFELRQGVKFHDGAPFNAAAVKANFDRVRDKSNGLRRWSLYNNIDQILIDGDYRVRFRLTQPFGAFFNSIAHPAGGIISPQAIATFGKDAGHHPVGTGPFKFVEWRLGQDVTVARNHDYWNDGAIHLDKIVFKAVREAQSTLDMLQAGQAHFVYPVPPVNFASVAGWSKATAVEGPSIYVNGMSMNNLHPPFSDPRVRQALNYAVDKQALLKVISYGHATALDSPMAPGTPGHVKVKTYGHDVKKAKSLLAEAGYGNGFSFTLWCTTATSPLAEFLQQQMQAVGVSASIQTYEGPTLTNLEYQPPEQNKLQAVVTGWSPSTGDADWALRPLFARTSWPPTLFNTAFYESAGVDEDVKKGLQTADWGARSAAYADAQRRIMDDAPWVFMHCQNVLAGVSREVGGAYVLPDATLVVSRAYFTAPSSGA
jgi:glutathione transport system substrate-binding protein